MTTTADKFMANQPACGECKAVRPERYGHFENCSQRQPAVNYEVTVTESDPPSAPQPAPDADGEWKYICDPNSGHSERFHIRAAGNGDCIAHTTTEKAAAQIVSNHRAVPLLVEALKNLLEYSAGLLLCLEARGVSLGEGPQMHAARAALTAATQKEN